MLVLDRQIVPDQEIYIFYFFPFLIPLEGKWKTQLSLSINEKDESFGLKSQLGRHFHQ